MLAQPAVPQSGPASSTGGGNPRSGLGGLPARLAFCRLHIVVKLCCCISIGAAVMTCRSPSGQTFLIQALPHQGTRTSSARSSGRALLSQRSNANGFTSLESAKRDEKKSEKQEKKDEKKSERQEKKEDRKGNREERRDDRQAARDSKKQAKYNEKEQKAIDKWVGKHCPFYEGDATQGDTESLSCGCDPCSVSEGSSLYNSLCVTLPPKWIGPHLTALFYFDENITQSLPNNAVTTTDIECPASPCDGANPLLSNRSWMCFEDTGNPIISGLSLYTVALECSDYCPDCYSYDNGVSKDKSETFCPNAALTPAVLRGNPPGVSMLTSAVQCVPQIPSNLSAGWVAPTDPESSCGPCEPCDPFLNYYSRPTWFCVRGTSNVCVNEYMWTVINLNGSVDVNGTTEAVVPGSGMQVLGLDGSCDTGVSQVLAAGVLQDGDEAYASSSAVIDPDVELDPYALTSAAVQILDLKPTTDIGQPIWTTWTMTTTEADQSPSASAFPAGCDPLYPAADQSIVTISCSCDPCNVPKGDPLYYRLCYSSGSQKYSRRNPCLASPCDPQNLNVSNRSWWCYDGTDFPVLSFDSITRFRRNCPEWWKSDHACSTVSMEPAQIRGRAAGVWIVSETEQCAPQKIPDINPVQLNWKDSQTGKTCGPPVPCDPDNKQVARGGWYCMPGTATVAVSNNSWSIISYNQSIKNKLGQITKGVVPGSAVYIPGVYYRRNKRRKIIKILVETIVVVTVSVATLGEADVDAAVVEGAVDGSEDLSADIVSESLEQTEAAEGEAEEEVAEEADDVDSNGRCAAERRLALAASGRPGLGLESMCRDARRDTGIRVPDSHRSAPLRLTEAEDAEAIETGTEESIETGSEELEESESWISDESQSLRSSEWWNPTESSDDIEAEVIDDAPNPGLVAELVDAWGLWQFVAFCIIMIMAVGPLVYVFVLMCCMPGSTGGGADAAVPAADDGADGLE